MADCKSFAHWLKTTPVLNDTKSFALVEKANPTLVTKGLVPFEVSRGEKWSTVGLLENHQKLGASQLFLSNFKE